MWVRKKDYIELQKEVIVLHEELITLQKLILNYQDYIIKDIGVMEDFMHKVGALDSVMESHFHDHNKSVNAQVREEVERIMKEELKGVLSVFDISPKKEEEV